MTTTEPPITEAVELPTDQLIEEATAKSDKLLDPKTFGFLDFIRKGGETLPTEEVVVFTDLETALRITGLTAARARLVELANLQAEQKYQQALLDTNDAEGTIAYVIPDRDAEEYQPVLPPQYEESAQQIADLNDRLWESRVVLTLKGIAPRWLKVIEDKMHTFRRSLNELKLPQDEVARVFNEKRTNELVAASLKSYSVPAKDIVSTERVTTDVVREMLAALAPSEQAKILQAVEILTYTMVISDPRTDAGFPSRHSVPAAEPGAAGADQDSVQLAPTP